MRKGTRFALIALGILFVCAGLYYGLVFLLVQGVD